LKDSLAEVVSRVGQCTYLSSGAVAGGSGGFLPSLQPPGCAGEGGDKPMGLQLVDLECSPWLQLPGRAGEAVVSPWSCIWWPMALESFLVVSAPGMCR